MRHLLVLLVCLSSACSGGPAADAGVDATIDAAIDAAIDATIDAAIDAPIDPTDGGASPDAGPQEVLAPPLGITFRDRDPARGTIAGVVTLERAEGESGIEAYELVAVDAAGEIVGGPLATLSRQSEPLEHTFTGSAWPEGAVDLGAISTGPGARSPLGPRTPGDDYVRYADAGGEGGSDPMATPSLLRHDPSGVVLAAGCDGEGRVSLRRCGAGGCPEIRSVGEARDCSSMDAAITDTHLYLATTSSSRSLLHVCPVDAAGAIGDCREGALTLGSNPSLALTATALYVATGDVGNSYRAAVDVCPLEGPSASSPCTHHDVSAGAAQYTGQWPTALARGNRLYVVADRGLSSCALDAAGTPSGCVLYAPGLDGTYTRGALGASRLYVASGSQLATCSLAADGTPTCAVRALGSGSSHPSLLVTSSSLYVAGAAGSGAPALHHCALDASGDPSGCTTLEHTTGHPAPIATPALAWNGTQILAYGTSWERDATSYVNALLTCTLAGNGAPTACAFEDVSVRPLGYHGLYPRAFRSPTHLYVMSRFDSGHYLAWCPLDAGGEPGACQGRAMPSDILTGAAVAHRGGALYVFGQQGGNASVSRCALEPGGALGSSCATYDVSGGALRSPRDAAIAFDRAVMLVQDRPNDWRATILACGFDASGAPADCSHVGLDPTLTAGNALGYGVTASATHAYAFMRVDRERVLYACPFDAAGALGGACVRTQVEADTSDNSGLIAGMAIVGDRIYLAHVDGDRPWLAVCALAAGVPTGCSLADVTAGSDERTRFSGLAVADGRLYIAGVGGANRPVLVACDVGADGVPSACLRHDASAGQGDGSASWTSLGLVHDPVRGALYLATDDAAHRHRPSLYWIRTF